MSKLTITCDDWRPLHRNTLQGFAVIKIAELQLIIKDIAVHEKNERRWAQLPARPQIKDGRAITGEDGKVQYFPLLNFTARDVADAFSRAVVAAILKHSPHAFDEDSAEPARTPVRADMDDEIPW